MAVDFRVWPCQRGPLDKIQCAELISPIAVLEEASVAAPLVVGAVDHSCHEAHLDKELAALCEALKLLQEPNI